MDKMRVATLPLPLLLLAVLGVGGHRTGAPESSCETMLPGHTDTSPQTGTPPYHLAAELQPDKTVRVILTGTFKGFLIQARLGQDGSEAIGEFTADDPAAMKTVPCGDKENGAVTHTNNDEKSRVTARWTAPPSLDGAVVFRATVVQSYNTYWEGVLSKPVTIKARNGDGSTKTTQGIRGPASECGDSVSCFSIPKNCVPKVTCKVFLTYVADKDGIAYEMTAPVTSDNVWIGTAVSTDKLMALSSVVECFLLNGQVHMRESWNSEGYSNQVLEKETKGLTLRKGLHANGMLNCSWHRQHVSRVGRQTFNTRENHYHILLASGKVNADSKATKAGHSIRGWTDTPLDLRAKIVSTGGSDSDVFIRLHGSLMLVAWVFLVSIGILLARHYKNVWESTMICGVKPWFAFHRGIMALSVLMIIAALVLIFYKIGRWSPVDNPHPILGIVCSVMGVFQPIMALFRCHPHEENRYIFNWLHWFNGNVAQILAVAAIFFAATLEKAQLKNADWFVYILAAFVGFHVLVHVVMQIHASVMDKKQVPAEIKLQDVHPVNGRDVPQGQEIPPPTSDAPGGGFRRFMLGIYVVVALLVVAALVASIWFAPA